MLKYLQGRTVVGNTPTKGFSSLPAPDGGSYRVLNRDTYESALRAAEREMNKAVKQLGELRGRNKPGSAG